ncbi:MAG: hypothetical protein ABSF91_13220 [Bacteroidota bacterium]|jgi:hypothetical protein
MDTIIEITLQVLIVGLITLAILGFVGNLHQSTYEKTSSVILETNLVTIASVIENDLNKIGYNAPKPAILRADSVFSFLADLQNTGAVKTVQYSKTIIPAGFRTPSDTAQDFGISRIVSGEPSIISDMHLSKLNFAYFDSTGLPTSSLAAIRSVNVMVELTNPGKTTTTAPSLFWTKTFYIQN